MVFPFYANSIVNRNRYNLALTNTAAVLTNEAYRRAIQREEVKRCVFIAGPYGAGKSFFVQSLFESKQGIEMLKDSIVYEGSITPPAFEEKINYAIQNNVTPTIIVLNPTLELSMRNIRERAKSTGRDVIRREVIDKFYGMYIYLKSIVEKYNGISYVIYSKESNIPVDLNSGSQNLDELNHGTRYEIEEQYDILTVKLDKEEQDLRPVENVVAPPTSDVQTQSDDQHFISISDIGERTSGVDPEDIKVVRELFKEIDRIIVGLGQ